MLTGRLLSSPKCPSSWQQRFGKKKKKKMLATSKCTWVFISLNLIHAQHLVRLVNTHQAIPPPPRAKTLLLLDALAMGFCFACKRPMCAWAHRIKWRGS